jgi:hypothetical protein
MTIDLSRESLLLALLAVFMLLAVTLLAAL